MKRVFVFMLLLWTVPCAAEPDSQRLTAPVYPGAVRVLHPEYLIGSVVPYDSERIDQSKLAYQADAFLTKDPIETVRTFYEGKIGLLFNDYLHGTTSHPQGKNWPHVYSRKIMDYSTVARILKNHNPDVGSARDIGLQITSKTIPATMSSQNSPYLMPFRNLVGFYGHTSRDLENVYQRFRRLDASYFQLTDEFSEPGGFRTEDEVLFRSCFIRLEGGIEVRERPVLEKRIKQLVDQNRMEEAIELGRKLNTPTVPGAKDTWKGWLECLERIEDKAFQTLIRIDRHPSHWTAR